MKKTKRQDPEIAAMVALAGELGARAGKIYQAAQRAESSDFYREMAESAAMERRATSLFREAQRLSAVRTRELAIIHVAKKEMGIADDAYHAMVRRITNGLTESAGDCRATERSAIIEELKAKGFSLSPKSNGGAPLAGKIRALWRALDAAGALKNGTDDGLRAWVKRQTGGRKDAPQWLTLAEANACIEALKQWLARVEDKDTAEASA